MTLKEFSDTYEVPYNIVYTASYLVKPTSITQRERDYPEDELYKQITNELNKRAQKHAELSGKYVMICQRMRATKQSKNKR